MGMDEEMVGKIHHYEDSDLSESVKLALRFTEGWVLHHAQTIDEALINKLKEHFTEPQIVELAITVGILEAVHKFNVAFDVEPPTSGLYQTGLPTTPEAMKRHLDALGFQPRIAATNTP